MSRSTTPLDVYREKRDFTRTDEPAGRDDDKSAADGGRFVVQKHDARRLHFDFRLELDGVLKSWAVTRGPSLDPADKRLAVRTEDHPVEYQSFEGTIPKGEYGGGTVMLWDRGRWQPRGDPRQGLEHGVLKFDLDGERLKGGFALVRLGSKARETRENWLLIKERDAHAERNRDAVELWNRSIASGGSMGDIAANKPAPAKRGRRTARRSKSKLLDADDDKEPGRRARSNLIAYTERTSDGVLRHPSFLGLREDKRATEVRMNAQFRNGEQREDKPREKAEIAGVKLTHPDKILFPAANVSKEGLASYLAAVSDRMLPHIRNRPLSLVRCPDGAAAQCFFQKHRTRGMPAELRGVTIKQGDGESASYMTIQSRAGLVAAAQIGTLELHIWGSRADQIERPDRLVFDLDPDESLSFADVRLAATVVRALLASADLESFPLVTGGKGIHVVVPLERRHDWDDVKVFAKAFATKLAEAEPDRFVATMSKARRKGRIFIDWLRNERGATAIAPYSVRAKPHAPVAMPVSWGGLAKDRARRHLHASRGTGRDREDGRSVEGLL